MKNGKNNVAGTWLMVSAQFDPGGKNVPIYGPNAKGLLIFTEDLYFTDIITDLDIPKFASNDRLNGTPEEYEAVATRSFGVYGTYTVDEEGDFFNEHLIAGSFPNWNDTRRDRSQNRIVVYGDELKEQLTLDDGSEALFIWKRAT
ncbi:lipocalin-like domain-containing protein [Mucilaginibacter litoreus]|uniref:Lipocalin-like domain-containing protein n=1 Tax=Mucilaginibacter litoreus TaxID=1048221 RepID=A0ABW3AWH5_9SPHI